MNSSELPSFTFRKRNDGNSQHYFIVVKTFSSFFGSFALDGVIVFCPTADQRFFTLSQRHSGVTRVGDTRGGN